MNNMPTQETAKSTKKKTLIIISAIVGVALCIALFFVIKELVTPQNERFNISTFDIYTMPAAQPFEYSYPNNPDEINSSTFYAGADISLARAIAQDLGKELKISEASYSGITKTLATSEKNSAAISAIVKGSDNISSKVTLSDPYYVSEQYIILKESDDTSAFTLNGKVIGVQKDSLTLDYCDGTSGFFKGALSYYDNVALAFEGLKNGEVQYVICEREVAQYIAENNPGFVSKNANFEKAKLCVAIPDNEPLLVEKINATIATYKESGKYEEDIIKYSLGQQ